MWGEEEWSLLLRRIKREECTPFLGAGASYGALPLGGEIAQRLAEKYQYPLADKSDLIRVAQYVAIKLGAAMVPKWDIIEMFENAPAPNFTDAHRALAELPLPIYLTTNYDDLMAEALKKQHRNPQVELCRWNASVRNEASVFDNEKFELHPATPVMFHLHGHMKKPSSLVLTEDDYLDFLINSFADPNMIPGKIRTALQDTSLLFIGYSIADWNFRVLLRSMLRFMESGIKQQHFAVMLSPAAGGEEAQQYLSSYYKSIDVRVYWGDVREFFKELRQRMKEAAGN